MKLHRDLREFIELLKSHAVEYLVIGGWAFGFHATPRYTGDGTHLGEHACRYRATGLGVQCGFLIQPAFLMNGLNRVVFACGGTC
jgi:hypothetical protein